MLDLVTRFTLITIFKTRFKLYESLKCVTVKIIFRKKNSLQIRTRNAFTVKLL